MSGGPTNVDFSAETDELKRWQQVEAEAWGTDVPAEEIHEPMSEESGLPLLLIFLFGIAFFGGVYYWTMIRPNAEPAQAAAPAYGKVVDLPSAARVVEPACQAFVERTANHSTLEPRLVEAGDDQVARAEVFRTVYLEEARLLNQVSAAEPDLALSVAPLNFYATLVVDGAADVSAGTEQLADVLERGEALRAQIDASEVVIADFRSNRC